LNPRYNIWFSLDVPQKENDKTTKEVAYLCPVFSKVSSYIYYGKDTFELKIAQLQWDLLELTARMIRKNQSDYMQKDKSETQTLRNEALKKYYSKSNEDVDDFYESLQKHIRYGVLSVNDEVEYEKCRKKIDEMLAEYSQYATTLDDCRRFLTAKPLNKKLKQLISNFPDNQRP